MANTKKTSKKKVSVKDLTPKNSPKGGRDAASGLPTGRRMWKPVT